MTHRKGFTLIEMLIVIAIIGILATLVLVGLGPVQKQARDARRLADLKSIQTALELYYNKCGFYPGPAQGNPTCTAAWSVTSAWNPSGAMQVLQNSAILTANQLPDDPTTGKHYFYGTINGGSSYIIGAILEDQNNNAFAQYTAPATAGYTGVASCTQPNYCIQF